MQEIHGDESTTWIRSVQCNR